MLISLNRLKKFCDLDQINAKDLNSLIGSRLVEIESIVDLQKKYESVVIAKVVSCVDHPDSDHLHICLIDDGGSVATVDRDDDGFVQVVCGAPNVREGLIVAWLPPKTIVPETYGTADPFELSVRKLRGVKSNGMLASPRELGLWNEHEGILEIGVDTAQPGDSLAKILEFNDEQIIEVENKSLTHRPDCFGLIGFGREVAAILGRKMNYGIDTLPANFDIDNTQMTPKILIKDEKLCARYQCVVVDGVDTTNKSSLLDQSYLSRMGIAPHDFIVDTTNLIMLDTGQPLHAFDLDKLIELSPTSTPDIVVRAGVKGEKLELLNDKVIELTPDDIVVAVGDDKSSTPVALAGAMGGKYTEVTDSTKRVLLESATFNLYNLRGTQFRHGIFTEAITRFTKGQPAEMTSYVLRYAISQLVDKYPSAKVSALVDNYPLRQSSVKFSIAVERFTDVLGNIDGQPYSEGLITKTLDNLGYGNIGCVDGIINACAPWWRTDLSIDEDVIEDVGRVNGYDNITSLPPTRPYAASDYTPLYKLQTKLRDQLSRLGGNELMTYSFVSKKLLQNALDDPNKAFQIVNAVSPHLQYYRRDLLPSLIDKVKDNIRSYDKFFVFEVGKVHRQGHYDSEDVTLPGEIEQVSGLLVDASSRADSAYYSAKKVVDYLLLNTNKEVKVEYTRLDKNDESLDSAYNLFEPTISAQITVRSDKKDHIIGYVGEFKKSVRTSFKLPEFSAGFTLFVAELMSLQASHSDYSPVFRYQGTSRDMTFRLNSKYDYGDLLMTVETKLASLLPDNIVGKVSPADIYRADDDHRHITLHFDFNDREKTINSDEVGKFITELGEYVDKKLGAKVI